MLTPKQNALEVINWGNPEYIPMQLECMQICGMPSNPFMGTPIESGYDLFGVKWNVTPEGCMPENSTFLMEDVTQWRDVIKIPDIKTVAPIVHQIAQAELGAADREQKLMQFFHMTGLFERLVSFMGFENALIALVSEPEACQELFAALTDFYIDCINVGIDAYQPDIWVYFDDVATARGLFMSPETWREVIKPYHARIVKAVTDRGVIFEQHCCGRCEDLVEDYVEMGAKMWHSAQTMNDIPAIQQKHKGQLVIDGGWDSSGPASYRGATADDIRAEVRRTINEYGVNGGYILTPLLMNEKGNAAIVGDDRFPALIDEWEKLRK